MGMLQNSNGLVPGVDSKPPERHIYKFGVFELRTETGELSKSGIRIRLQTRPCQVLQALLERPGQLVTREELRARLWPSGTFVDFESGLNTATNRLRSALGDSADAPRYIETLPRLGYRFVCPVTEVNAAGTLPGTADATPIPVSQSMAPAAVPEAAPRLNALTTLVPARLRSPRSIALAALIVSAAILLTWYLQSDAAGHPQHVLQQLTFHTGMMRAANVFAPHSASVLAGF